MDVEDRWLEDGARIDGLVEVDRSRRSERSGWRDLLGTMSWRPQSYWEIGDVKFRSLMKPDLKKSR
jgi:hypothetical protein